MTTSIPILPVDTLRPTEETEPDHVLAVAEAILRAGVWTDPILVECEARAVLDGHHRLAAAYRLGLGAIPAHLVGYGAVTLTSRRPDQVVTPAEVLARARSGRLYPPKTTRHDALVALTAPTAVPLAQLRGVARFGDHVRWIWKAGDPVPDREARRYAAA
ncbi:MAG: ParB N-terminal domain-containing protein [Salinarimonas sp.]